jgi:hypothetical protein
MTHRRKFRGVAIAAVLLAVGCQRGPTSPSSSSPPPSPPTLPLVAGLYAVSFGGFDSSTDPAFPPCPPIGIPPAGKRVMAWVEMRPEGADWVGRPTVPSEGDLEIRLRRAGTSIFGTVVSGSATGTVSDTSSPARDVAVSVDGAVDGTLSVVGLVLNGRVDGSIVFYDSTGASSTCSAVQWLMSRVQIP